MEMKKQIYRNDKGEIHREDGPAVICSNGTLQWWVNNNRHRVGAPAIIFADGEEWYYQNDKRHREDGPAITKRKHGVDRWYLNGVDYTEPEYYKELYRRGLISEAEYFLYFI